MSERSKRGTTHRVQVSYLEIYQEKVADLLRGRDNTSLKVREHPKKGPYVQGLTTCLVTNYGHIQECMNRYYIEKEILEILLYCCLEEIHTELQLQRI